LSGLPSPSNEPLDRLGHSPERGPPTAEGPGASGIFRQGRSAKRVVPRRGDRSREAPLETRRPEGGRPGPTKLGRASPVRDSMIFGQRIGRQDGHRSEGVTPVGRKLGQISTARQSGGRPTFSVKVLMGPRPAEAFRTRDRFRCRLWSPRNTTRWL